MRLRSQHVVLAAGLALAAAGCAEGDGTDLASLDSGAQAARRSSIPDIDPQQLIGLSPAQVVGLLGVADFRRADGPAELWQYRDNACVLDMYLYASPTRSGEQRVEHIQARDRTVGGSAEEACLTHLLRARREPAPG